MNADTRMAVSLLLSLMLSANNLMMAAAGKADIVIVGVRYVVGFVICFLLVGIVGRLFNTYLHQLSASEMAIAGGGDLATGDEGFDPQAAASSDT